MIYSPDNKVHGANMGPNWVLPAPDWPHVGPINLAIRVSSWCHRHLIIRLPLVCMLNYWFRTGNDLLSKHLPNRHANWTSCAHKWGQYTPALITIHLIQKYPMKISILIIFSESFRNPIFGQIFGHQRAKNEARNMKLNGVKWLTT